MCGHDRSTRPDDVARRSDALRGARPRARRAAPACRASKLLRAIAARRSSAQRATVGLQGPKSSIETIATQQSGRSSPPLYAEELARLAGGRRARRLRQTPDDRVGDAGAARRARRLRARGGGPSLAVFGPVGVGDVGLEAMGASRRESSDALGRRARSGRDPGPGAGPPRRASAGTREFAFKHAPHARGRVRLARR